jgi:hypothetical protein
VRVKLEEEAGGRVSVMLVLFEAKVPLSRRSYRRRAWDRLWEWKYPPVRLTGRQSSPPSGVGDGPGGGGAAAR